MLIRLFFLDDLFYLEQESKSINFVAKAINFDFLKQDSHTTYAYTRFVCVCVGVCMCLCVFLRRNGMNKSVKAIKLSLALHSNIYLKLRVR